MWAPNFEYISLSLRFKNQHTKLRNKKNQQNLCISYTACNKFAQHISVVLKIIFFFQSIFFLKKTENLPLLFVVGEKIYMYSIN